MKALPQGHACNAMTVDVEDYFQVSAFEKNVDRNHWDDYLCRIPENMDRILALFDDKNIKATFFTLGWVAKRYPDMVKQLVENGHEVASHGMTHTRVTTQTDQAFRMDIRESKQLLEDLTGQPVNGYRAASYSINESNKWAWDALRDEGFLYSSSISPIKHDLYGMPNAPRFPFFPLDDDFLEIPVSTVKLLSRNFPCGGGGWFRLFPYMLSRLALKHINSKEKMPANFYFHPWEIDPEQPRIENASSKSRFRHYLNLARMYDRLEELSDDFSWGRMDQVYLR